MVWPRFYGPPNLALYKQEGVKMSPHNNDNQKEGLESDQDFCRKSTGYTLLLNGSCVPIAEGQAAVFSVSFRETRHSEMIFQLLESANCGVGTGRDTHSRKNTNRNTFPLRFDPRDL